MDDFIELKIGRITSLSEDNFLLSFRPKGAMDSREFKNKSKLLYRMDWVFATILKEFGLTPDAYQILFKLDRKSLKKLLGTKAVKAYYFGNNEFIGLFGCYSPAIINYLNANFSYFESFQVMKDTIEFSTGNFFFECSAFSDQIRVFVQGSDVVKAGITEIRCIPMIKDFGPVVQIKDADIADTVIYSFENLKTINFTIYDLLKFKLKISSFIDILYQINKTLGIREISEVQGDYRSIIIDTPVSYLYDKFWIKNPFETFEFLDYFLGGKYLKFRSKYTKIINIGV